MLIRLYFIICLLFLSVSSNGQTANLLIRQGNKFFHSGNYTQAEVFYRKAVDKEGSNAIANYNLGRSLQAQKKNEEAKKLYEKAASSTKAATGKSSCYYNLGTILQEEKDYAKAMDAYKNALRQNPGHQNARYNLELCRRQQKKQQQNQSGGGKNEQRTNKDRKKNQPQNKNQDNSQKNEHQTDNQGMSKDNAEQLLNAVKQQERETQERLSKAMRQPSERKLDKNW